MITVGISSYNQQDFLSDAIESALKQTVNCEIICCNDGSTDNSLEIAKKYPIKIINQVNKGLASARNSIIMNMIGDFFLPLDADDILMDNAVERISEVIKENPDADIIAPSFKEFGLSNREVVLMKDPKLKDFKDGNRIGYFSAIRKSKLLEIGGYNPKMNFAAEDYDLWFDLLKRGAIIKTLPEILVLYRTKENSMWTEGSKRREEFMAQIYKNHPDVFTEK